MFRQVGIGAATVMSLGLLAAGCSSGGGDTVITGGSGGDLNNGDNFPAGSVASNQLSPDNGGLSDNNADVDEFKVVFNCDCAQSDGTFAGDNSALLLFRITEQSTSRIAVFASHYDGQKLTPPVEITMADRNEQKAVSLSSYVCIPMNTKNYQSSQTNPSTAVTNVRNNDGNWLIIGDYATRLNLRVTGVQMQKTAVKGPQKSIGSWVFLKSLRDTEVTTSNKVSGKTQTFRYGFQQVGDEVNTLFVAGGCAATDTGSEANTNDGMPPCHVVSYGAATDTFCGQATFGGDALPFQPDSDNSFRRNKSLLGNSNDTRFNMATPLIGKTGAGDPQAVSNTDDVAAYHAASYTVGEATNFIRAYWVQVANSVAGGGSFIVNNLPGPLKYEGGAELKGMTRPYNMATMTWGTEVEDSPPAARNAGTSATRAGTAPFPIFHTYNNHLYYKYGDASLVTNTGANFPNTTQTFQNLLAMSQTGGQTVFDWEQDETAGNNGGAILHNNLAGGRYHGFWEEIIVCVALTDDNSGSNTIATANERELGRSATAHGVASTDNPTINGGNAAGAGGVPALFGQDDSYPERIMANFPGGKFIFGPDEGLADVTVFFVQADNTNTGTATTGTDGNIDRELMAVCLNASDGNYITQGGLAQSISGPHQHDWHGQDNNAVNGTHVGSDPNTGTGSGAGGNNFNGFSDTTNRASLKDPVVHMGLKNGNANAEDFPNAGYPSPKYCSFMMNRTGTTLAIVFLKEVGLSVNATTNAGSHHQAGIVRFCQFVRPVATTGGTGTVTPVALASRFAPALTAQGTEFTGFTTSPTAPGGPTGVSGARGPNTGGNTEAFQSRAADANDPNNWDRSPINDAWFQGCAGYRGMQSNNTRLALLFEQSDGTEDRLFAVRLTATTNTNGTPTLVVGTPAEVEATATVKGHSSYKMNAGFGGSGNDGEEGVSTFRFLDGTATSSNVLSADAVNIAGGAGNGDVLLCYLFVTDATLDTNALDAEVRVATFDGTTIANKQAIDRGTFEQANTFTLTAGFNNSQSAGNPESSNTTSANSGLNVGSTFGARVHKIACVPNNADIATADYPTTQTGAALYLYFGDREGDRITANNTVTVTGNGSALIALYTRKVSLAASTGTTTTFVSRFTPGVTGGPTATTYVEPTRLDHEQGVADDVTKVDFCCQSGAKILLVWEQGNHIWGQTSSDGVEYLKTSGGLPNPALGDNDSAANIESTPAYRVECCTDKNGDTNGGMLIWAKADRTNVASQGDRRLQLRGNLMN